MLNIFENILTFVVLIFFSLSSYYYIWKRVNNKVVCTLRIGILVVGDLGRSPRMQHHALALAQAYGPSTCEIFLIGSHGTKCREEVENSSRICIHRIPNPFIDRLRQYFFIDKLPFLNVFFYLIKMIELSFGIVYILLKLPSLHCLIVQNPPAVPALPLLMALKYILGYQLIVDWHNYGYTILGLSTSNQLLISMYRFFEVSCCRWADQVYCVSKAMNKDILKKGYVKDASKIMTVYDRPVQHIDLSCDEKYEFFKRFFPGNLNEKVEREPFQFPTAPHKDTWFTMGDGSKERNKTVACIVTATSWTPDEDLSMLFNVLRRYEEECKKESLPKLVMVMTGKGLLQKEWLEKASKVSWCYVSIITCFLSYSDYLKLLGIADLGLSFHASSSGNLFLPCHVVLMHKQLVCNIWWVLGVDLPMKIVDFQSSALPVLALGQPTLDELVTCGKTGDFFSNEDDLYNKMIYYLKDFSKTNNTLTKLREETRRECCSRLWYDEWTKTAKPFLDTLVN